MSKDRILIIKDGLSQSSVIGNIFANSLPTVKINISLVF
jgi:hypothetical protein